MDFTAPLNSFVAGFPDFIIQLAVALGLFVASIIIYVMMTPHKELALIRAGNPSAALAFAGVVALPFRWAPASPTRSACSIC
jgi:putative membrane protein